jgi:hypothetical protein
MTEEWKDVVGYEGIFEVSSKGQMRRKGKDVPLKQLLNKKGYYAVATKPSGRYGLNKTFRVHREVAKAFIPNPDGKPQVNHKDGVKINNNVSNLEWATASENVRHALEHGLNVPRYGDDNSQSKISDSSVLQAYLEYNSSTKSLREIARPLGVCHQTLMRRFERICS